MTLKELKRKVLDIFNFILLSCPDFPPETQTTLAKEFDELAELISMAQEATRSDDSKQWLRICLQEIAKSRRHYEEGNQKQGRYEIQCAEEHFNNAFSRTQTTPRFMVGESGAAEDSDSGFPA